MDTKFIDFQKYVDDRGNLVVAECGKEIPFDVKRIYYIYDVDGNKSRGFHAHKQLQQIYFCISGSCRVKLSDGDKTDTVVLDNPSKGLYIGHNVWREIYGFSRDGILVVLASEVYEEDDYIRSYDEFLKITNKSC